MTLVKVLVGLILAVVRALLGALTALFSSFAVAVVAVAGMALVVWALLSVLGVGLARRRGR